MICRRILYCHCNRNISCITALTDCTRLDIYSIATALKGRVRCNEQPVEVEQFCVTLDQFSTTALKIELEKTFYSTLLFTFERKHWKSKVVNTKWKEKRIKSYETKGKNLLLQSKTKNFKIFKVLLLFENSEIFLYQQEQS